jgi:hypothetical protein
VLQSHEVSTHYLSCSGVTDRDSTKMCPHKLRQNCVFSSGGMYRSRSAFWCVQGVKYRCTIFHAQVGRSGFLEKRARRLYAKLVCLQPVGSVSHVLNFGTSGVQNVDALFFVLRLDRYGLHKK